MSSPAERLSFLPDFPGRGSLYHPLNANKDEIRVITVQPSQERSSTIHCFLQTISIQDGRSTVPYDAVSYVWGSTETTDNINVHNALSVDQPDCGIQVPVTCALTGALRQFRAKATESKKPLSLWTDAVCINQLDAGERSQQVAIMKRVYEAATSVLIWLGEGDLAAETGLVNLFGLATLQQATVTNPKQALDVFDYHDFNTEPDVEHLKRVNAIFLNFDEPSGYDGYEGRNFKEMGPDIVSWVESISALLNLSYWYRGWTFQEACVNDHILVHYGQVRCRLNDWGSLWDLMNENRDLFKWLENTSAPVAITEFSNWLFAAAHSVSAQARSPEGLLPMGRYLDNGTKFRMLDRDLFSVARPLRRTADPRDQVYSQMGILNGIRLLGLKPDYTLTTEQVFTATTLAILHVSQTWNLPPFLTPSGSPFMPSWAIDFTLAPDLDISKVHTLFRRGHFNAHLGASFRSRMLQSETLLTAGFIYDEIVTVERCDRQRSALEATFPVMASTIINNKTALLFLACRTENDFWITFSRTLCMGMVGEVQFGPHHAADCRRYLSHEHGHELLVENLPSLIEEMIEMGELAHREGMSFIVTRNGHLGMVASNVHPGDRIAILAGGDVPFVLRKVRGCEDYGGAYILLGGCYVDGKVLTPPLNETRC